MGFRLLKEIMHQTIYYSPASCGAGKTRWAVNQMASIPKRYVYAVDRIEEFAVRAGYIIEAAKNFHTSPAYRFLSSKEMLGDRKMNVGREFPFTISDNQHEPHVIVFITHEALKLVDHRGMVGWELIVDEDPKLWSSADLPLGASVSFWKDTYNLEHFTDGFSVLKPRADAPSFSEMSHDLMCKSIASLHDRARKRDMVVNLCARAGWDSLKTRQQMTYYTMWDVREVAEYDRVTILANSFDKLVSFRLIDHFFPEVSLVVQNIGVSETWLPRDLTINYVASCHRAGSHFFKNTKQGQAAVLTWNKWARGMVDAPHHYWAVNKKRTNVDLPGVNVSPKIAGSNDYKELTQCSILYHAKASPAENNVFSNLTDGLISREDVMRDREYEDLVQIVFRSSLREANDTRAVMVNVYDLEQAEFLKSYFEKAGFPFNVSLVHHDLGITYVKEKPGRKPDPTKPAMTTAERVRAHRRARKLAEAEGRA